MLRRHNVEGAIRAFPKYLYEIVDKRIVAVGYENMDFFHTACEGTIKATSRGRRGRGCAKLCALLGKLGVDRWRRKRGMLRYL